MSAVAEPIAYGTIDDALARRNAMVLAVAQALAGGNNTVIVFDRLASSARCWRPTRAWRRCRSPAMVIGMWLGTLPIGALARRYRPPLRAADRLGLRHPLRA